MKMIWYISTVALVQLIKQSYGTTQTRPIYMLTLPSTYPKDTEFLSLDPIIYSLFFKPEVVRENLQKYKLSVPEVITRQPGSRPQGHQDSSVLECAKAGKIQTSSIEEICIDLDTKMFRTTTKFDPKVSTNLELDLRVKIIDPREHTKEIDMIIHIKPKCIAQHAMVKKIDPFCLPSIKQIQRDGFHKMLNHSNKYATKFKVENPLNKPIIITKMKILNNNLKGSNERLIMSIDALGEQDKTVVNLKISERVSRDELEIKLDIFSPANTKAIAVLLQNSNGDLCPPTQLEYYYFDDFCLNNSACYQEVSLWESYLNTDSACPKNVGTLSRLPNFKRCIRLSHIEETPTLQIYRNTPNDKPYKGMKLTVECDIGTVYVPHEVSIERISKYDIIEKIEDGKKWETFAEFEDMTYYRCVVNSYHADHTLQQTDWELTSLNNIFKTRLAFRSTQKFNEELLKTDSDAFKDMASFFNEKMKNFAKNEYPDETEFQVINFEKYSDEHLKVYGAFSMTKTSNKIRTQSYGKWLESVKKMIEDAKNDIHKLKKVEMKAYGHCLESTTKIKSMAGEDVYNWDAMNVTESKQKQPCKRNIENYITAQCVENTVGRYAVLQVDDEQCTMKDSDIDLTELAKVNVTTDNIEKVSEKLRNLTFWSKNFTTHDVQSSVTSLENIVDFVSSGGKVSDNFFQSVDDVLAVESGTMMTSQNSNSTSQRLMDVIGKAGGQIAKDPPKTINKTNFALGGMKISKSSIKDLVAKATSKDSADSSLHITMGSITDAQMEGKADSSIVIPFEVAKSIGEASTTDEMDFIAVVYRTNVIFQSHSEAQIVGSDILSAEIRGQSVHNTSESIKMMFKPSIRRHGKLKADQYKCVYWNVSKQGWSTNGMDSFYHHENGMYECHSNHLTNFAVLFNAGDVGENDAEILSIITYVGLGLNMAGAVLTLLTYIIFPILRENVPPKILMNLCIALIMVSIIFLVGAARENKTTISCEVASFFLQYSFLAVFCWSAIEGFHSVRGLVFPMKTDIRSFVTKAMPIGWGLPLLFTGIGFGAWKDEYIGETRCVVSGRPFYVTVLVPIVFIILFNIVSLVAIMLSLKGSSEKYTTHALTPRQRTRIITAFMILFGLTWVFGFLVINNDRVVFQYLFCVISSMQGLYVFIFYGLRNKKVRLFWMALLRGKSPQYIQRANTKQLEGKKRNKKRTNTDDSYSMTTSQNYTISMTVNNGTKLGQSPPRNENIYTVS